MYVLKLYRCFGHGLKMCICFGYYPQILFCYFLHKLSLIKFFSCFVYLVILNNLHHVSSNITRQTSSGGGHKISKFACLFLF